MVVPGASSLGSFTDPAGDSGSAVDVTAVSVDNDASGNITIAITTNQPALPADAVLILPFDADRNAATGSPSGIEYSFQLRSTGPSLSVWTGSTFAPAPSTTLGVSYTSGVARLTINKSELGNTSGFAFRIVSSFITGGQAGSIDLAPDSGAYTYVLATPATVAEGKPVAKTPGVHAGKRFRISAPVTTSARPVTVTCAARVGRKALVARGRYAAGAATCSGVVPSGTAGKRLTGLITAAVTGARQTKPFSFAIAR